MIDNPDCAVCRSRDWQEIGRRRWDRTDIGRCDTDTASRLSVLFDLWQPGSNAVELVWSLCRQCGFVSYAPRPTAGDIDGKYRHLLAIGLAGAVPDPDAPAEQARAQRMTDKLLGIIGNRHALRVLDFGGMDGRLLRGLADDHDCFVVDYNDFPVAGVTRLGATEADLSADDLFDLIVCSHVIEHVPSPVDTLASLARHLKPGGNMYVEVPMEIWGRAPIQAEPVTHINFFTPASLERALFEAGLHCRASKLSSYLSGSNLTERLAVEATATQRGAKIKPPPRSGAEETLRFLQPGLAEKLHKYMKAPGLLAYAVRQRAGRLVGARH